VPGTATDTTSVVHPHTDDGRVRMRHRRWFSWLTSALLVVVIGGAVVDAADVVDVWGVDTGTVEAVGASGTRLSVRHPSVTRPALASPFEIVVEQPGGFDGEVELAVDVDYLTLWDVNGIFPAPSSEVSDDRRVIWTFDPPEGSVLRVTYEARIEPGAQLESRRGTVSLLEDGEPSLTVRFTTRVRP
jgi:hypothetical protein